MGLLSRIRYGHALTRCRVRSMVRLSITICLLFPSEKSTWGEMMHKRLATLLNGLRPNWKEKLIGCCTDGAQSKEWSPVSPKMSRAVLYALGVVCTNSIWR
ncbi:hypothetical protein XU18_0387 [Perkinsela sp. CCAP 1560/4]|nr:hypothetical protein XU18_0387 [Perkinsela sp. CCAP 1560/4]|eukprot:KNH09702.1 hypothetical protein XU18_0387 [Perkinsela sp. CCAP 1560/4]